MNMLFASFARLLNKNITWHLKILKLFFSILNLIASNFLHEILKLLIMTFFAFLNQVTSKNYK